MTEKKIQICKRIAAAFLVSCFVIGLLGGCGEQKSSDNAEKRTAVIKIPVVLTVNPTTGKKSNQKVVDAFN